MPFSEEQAAAYLAAMIDGEGTVSVPGSTFFVRAVRITNTDYSLIEAIKQCCDILGINYTICASGENGYRQKRGWRKAWVVNIQKRRSLMLIQEKVPIQSAKKRERLTFILSSYKRPLKPTRDELHNLYYIKKLSYSEIAKVRGCALPAVQVWMRSYELTARADSESVLLSYSKRKESVDAI